jgi:hypothetical protein
MMVGAVLQFRTAQEMDWPCALKNLAGNRGRYFAAGIPATA